MRRVVCHGDSLTEGSELERGHTWPALLERKLAIRIINTGIGGDTTAGMLSRFNADVLRHRPGIVLILGGTNDLWWDLSIPAVLANIFAMACQAQYHRIEPLIGIPIPLCLEKAQQQNMLPPLKGFQRCLEQLQGLVRALRVAAAQSEIPVLDFFDLFMDTGGQAIGDYYLEDGLHPNRQGHLQMAGKAAATIRSMLPPG